MVIFHDKLYLYHKCIYSYINIFFKTKDRIVVLQYFGAWYYIKNLISGIVQLRLLGAMLLLACHCGSRRISLGLPRCLHKQRNKWALLRHCLSHSSKWGNGNSQEIFFAREVGKSTYKSNKWHLNRCLVCKQNQNIKMIVYIFSRNMLVYITPQNYVAS